MLKSLYTTATGMKAQQTNVDMIANNIANVNTAGFKKSQASFEDLLYVTQQAPGLARGTDNVAVPTGTQIGSGTRLSGTTKVYSPGMLEPTDRQLDVAIDGDGFFGVRLPDGGTGYTRDGAFQINAEGKLVTSQGHILLPEVQVPNDTQGIALDAFLLSVNTRSSCGHGARRTESVAFNPQRTQRECGIGFLNLGSAGPNRLVHLLSSVEDQLSA